MDADDATRTFLLVTALSAATLIVATVARADFGRDASSRAALAANDDAHDDGVRNAPSAQAGNPAAASADPEASGDADPGAAPISDDDAAASDGSGADDPDGSGSSAADGSGAGSPGAEGSGDGAAAEGTAVAPADAWAPLARADQGDVCRVRLNRGSVATEIHRREPRGTEGPFLANGQPIYIFVDVHNSTGVAQPLTIYWQQTDTGYSFLQTMEAGAGSRWRTWTEQPLALEQIGPWTVRLLDEDRCLVEELRFELQAPSW